MAFEIVPLPKERWKGAALPMRYTTDAYYDLSVDGGADGFTVSLVKKPLEAPAVHDLLDGDFPDRLYADWWEGAEAFGILGDGRLLAAVEICPEEWSKRLMITELWVGEELRGRGFGRRLIELAKVRCVAGGYRALILETQSCNANAVAFYLHMGFQLIGFDSCCYTNRDIERGEVRLDMGWFPDA